MKHGGFVATILLTSICAVSGISAADDKATGDLIKASQNPITHLTSVAFQNNFNLGYGPNSDQLQYFLKIQPTIPFSLDNGWSLITRHILQVYCQSWPRETSGLGNLQQFFCFAPPQMGDFRIGAGPGIQYPTATNDTIGNHLWSAAPTGVIEYSKGPLLGVVTVYNFWSFGSDSVNEMTIQPLLLYNLPNRYFLSSAPIISADWTADTRDRWAVQLGGGGGRLFFIGKMPMIVAAQGYYSVLVPRDQADWTARVFVQFIFS